MPVYRANCVVRNRAGREVASRYPLWSGAADDARGAVERATEALGELDLPSDADTIVVKVQGPGGEQLAVTEYAEDVLAGRVVSADMSTLLSDAPDQSDGDKRAAIDALRRQAVAVMPEMARRAAERQAQKPDAPAGETATVRAEPADPLQDFFGPGWKPTVREEPKAEETIYAPGPGWESVGPLDMKMIREAMRKAMQKMMQDTFLSPTYWPNYYDDKPTRKPDNPPAPPNPPLRFRDGEVKAEGGVYARGGPVKACTPVYHNLGAGTVSVRNDDGTFREIGKTTNFSYKTGDGFIL